MRRLLAVLLLPACSYAAYTPPARMMPLETADAPVSGSSDVQLEASRVGSPLGFSTDNGALRVRHGLSPHVAIDAEGGLMHVAGGADSTAAHDAYLGRVGVHLHSIEDPEHASVAATGGVGSGYSPLAGRWISYDAGLIGETEGRHAALFWSVEAWGSHPIDPQPFAYTAGGDVHSDILSDTRGVRTTGGVVWWPSGRGGTALMFGTSYGGVEDDGDSDQVMAIGAALRAKL